MNEFTETRLRQYREEGYASPFGDVARFHANFGLLPLRAAPLEKILARKRADQMREELREFEDACADGDALKAVDALADMVYFALGAAVQMGVSPKAWHDAWREVHLANMRKLRDARADTLKQGICKPAGWIGPEAGIYWALEADGFDLSYACPGCKSQGFEPSHKYPRSCTACDGSNLPASTRP